MSSSNYYPEVNGSDEAEKSSKVQAVSVLFVCLGNICRSPMAEAVFRSLTPNHTGVSKVDSAGTAAAYHEGDPPDPRTMDTLEDNSIVDYDHEARKVMASDFTDFNYILAMDKDNLSDLRSMKNRLIKKDPTLESRMGNIQMFGDFGGRKGEQVVDPYYGARNGFSVAYEQMVRFSKGFIEEVVGEESVD